MNKLEMFIIAVLSAFVFTTVRAENTQFIPKDSTAYQVGYGVSGFTGLVTGMVVAEKLVIATLATPIASAAFPGVSLIAIPIIPYTVALMSGAVIGGVVGFYVYEKVVEIINDNGEKRTIEKKDLSPETKKLLGLSS